MNLLRELRSSSLWLRALFIFILAWAVLVCVFVANSNIQTPNESDELENLINQALQNLKQAIAHEEELRKMVNVLVRGNANNPTPQTLIEKDEYNMQKPSMEYEIVRRRIYNSIGEMWNYFSAELVKLRMKITPKMPELEHEINDLLQLGAEHKRSLLSDMGQLRQVDGYEAWREQESRDLSDLVQRRLRHLQNPKDCETARKLICRIDKYCGYGCQIHHITNCFIAAYATERTMILKSGGWKYCRGGWEKVFQPLSESCLKAKVNEAKFWPGEPNTQEIIFPIIEILNPRPPFLPLAIPEDLASRLKRLHGDPFVWWVGQFLKYLMRPQNQIEKFLKSEMTAYQWKKPIVGVHVRRTDKIGTEAAYHSIEEYMTHVEDYFLTQEINGSAVTRRIFLATDDPSVIKEAREKYPHYEVIGNAEVARLAGRDHVDSASLNGIILDIHLLSLSDYLVCTFSSQVCRVAYEIMQTLSPDAPHRFKSLDDIYYYGGQNPHNRQAVIAHVARNHYEIDLKPGDLVGIAGNLWNGFSNGTNRRTKQIGVFPSFKVVDKVELAKMSIYEGV